MKKPVYSTDLLCFFYDEFLDNLYVAVTKRVSKPFAGLYSLPGGVVEPDETSKQAIKRITKAKTGLNVHLHDIETLGLYDNPNVTLGAGPSLTLISSLKIPQQTTRTPILNGRLLNKTIA